MSTDRILRDPTLIPISPLVPASSIPTPVIVIGQGLFPNSGVTLTGRLDDFRRVTRSDAIRSNVDVYDGDKLMTVETNRRKL